MSSKRPAGGGHFIFAGVGGCDDDLPCAARAREREEAGRDADAIEIVAVIARGAQAERVSRLGRGWGSASRETREDGEIDAHAGEREIVQSSGSHVCRARWAARGRSVSRWVEECGHANADSRIARSR